MTRPCYIIDAFASEPYSGNPAAVVLDADGLDEATMQHVAAEFNLSETAFVLPPKGAALREGADAGPAADLGIHLRWFTPTAEVAMCGHATIATAHALVESGRLPVGADTESVTLRIETLSGLLTAFIESIPGVEGGCMIWLDLIDPILAPVTLAGNELGSVLNLSTEAFDTSLPIVQTQDDDLLAFVRDHGSLNDVRPDFAALAKLLAQHGVRGLCLATIHTLTPSISVQSRFFAPAVGIAEDPVTGSVHGPLAVHLVTQGVIPVQDGLAALTCTQGRPGGRTGLVHALVQPKGGGVCAVRIGGRAVTTVRGTLTV
jgi:PhzF family phenazine biosynthesis protein